MLDYQEEEGKDLHLCNTANALGIAGPINTS